jgi:benzoate membrane transport protein
MIRQLSIRAIGMGLLAAFVGYAASFAIVVAGLTAMGASAEESATGLFFATIGMGVCGIWLALTTRTPAAVAWSTPGAAFLVSTSVLPGGFQEATGAFILCAVLIVITGFIPALGRLVGAIPKPIASALLAGVILSLCFAPARALGDIPFLVLPILLAWLLGLRLHKLAAMPFAVAAFVAVLFVVVDADSTASNTAAMLPAITAAAPVFSISAFISVSVPLYLVTMAGQNIPGFAVLELKDYPVDRPRMLRDTGLTSLAIAPFGAIPVNMSAITAAMMCGDDAGPHRERRYWAAVVCGLAFVCLAFASGSVLALANQAPAGLITAVAGLALIPALVASLSAAFSESNEVEAPALTFLIAASGITLLGISAAFWGVLAGVIVWLFKRTRQANGNP